ncbi:MAG: hypothetical protein CMQ36_11645 [Gammaproteobacteria bacterium]|nr:hypothetical protein [Gammaproteobacteria bacterium]
MTRCVLESFIRPPIPLIRKIQKHQTKSPIFNILPILHLILCLGVYIIKELIVASPDGDADLRRSRDLEF